MNARACSRTPRPAPRGSGPAYRASCRTVHAAGFRRRQRPAPPARRCGAQRRPQRRAEEIEHGVRGHRAGAARARPRCSSTTASCDARRLSAQRLGIDCRRAPSTPPGRRRSTCARCTAHSVLATFCRLVEREFDRILRARCDGENAEAPIRRWGFHAVDITPCADGRLSGVVDYILRVPPAVVASRKSYAGAMFDVEEALRHWETVELRRFREEPNAATAPTRYLKIGVYHFSSADPRPEGCAAHGNDAAPRRRRRCSSASSSSRAAVATSMAATPHRDAARRRRHRHRRDPRPRPGCGGPDVASTALVDNLALYDATATCRATRPRTRSATRSPRCAGVAADDPATEGMRWFCGYLLKNNLAPSGRGARLARRPATPTAVTPSA